MDFELSEEQQIFKDAFSNFAQREILPLAREAEQTGEVPAQVFKMAGDLGYLCVGFPVEYGGSGMDMVTEAIHAELLGQYCGMGLSGCLMVQSGIGTRIILEHGSEAQKQKYLCGAATGELISAFGLTEPDAGSDAAAIKTTAKRDGDEVVLNGSKIFITNGNIAEFTCIAAYTDKEKGPKAGISIFIVEKGTEGYTTKHVDKYVALSADTAEIFMEDCRIPAENLVGEEGNGFPYLMEVLYGGRVTHAARSVGLAQSALDMAVRYAKERVQFGRPIGKFQAIRFKLAQMATELEAARRMVYFAAWTLEHKKPGYKMHSSMAKLFASEVAQRVSEQAMQIHGGYGITKDFEIFPIFAGLRLATVTEGTSEIQRLIIARELGL